MSAGTNIRTIALSATPADVVARWPNELPLAALISCGSAENTRTRWSILAIPASSHSTPDVTRGDLLGEVPLPREVITKCGLDIAAEIPFTGGWIGFLSYQLGRLIEPTAQHSGGREQVSEQADNAAGFPLMTWHRCDAALVHDAANDRWSVVGNDKRLESLVRAIQAIEMLGQGTSHTSIDARYRVSNLQVAEDHTRYERSVRRTVEYIRAGDVFQANIAHRLEADFAGSPRVFFRDLLEAASPWYGAYIETPGGVIASASPELFLKYEANTRRVETRPMKGTRPAEAGALSLAQSEKDRAELNMIIDLMRNDLGRVCEIGSIHVEDARAIEPHGNAVLQGVATVSGRLREGLSVRDLLRATFPPGSVTGAPKVRAMQIIDELETFERGPYCGAIGYISDSGNAQFSVAIRTALISGLSPSGNDGESSDEHGRLRYSVGAGIVSDSDAEEEWRETMVKGRPLFRTIGAKLDLSGDSKVTCRTITKPMLRSPGLD